MIFVTVGSDQFQFNRLIQAVDEYCGLEKEHAYIQLGSSDYRPRHCQWSEFLPFDQVEALMKESSVVIAHAGAGTILECIRSGKVPIVVPRLSQFGEAIDDHQASFAYWMQEHGYAYVADLSNLAEVIRNFKDSTITHSASTKTELVGYLTKVTRNWAA
ncbi:MAG: PssE/Cps14G family polysaccharide biosynthesis glycosyltransferase [Candidatus Aquicultor sp.]